MKNILLLSMMLLLFGCSHFEDQTSSKQANKVEEQKIERGRQSEIRHDSPKPLNKQSEKNLKGGFYEYRPKVGMKKIFTENGQMLFTEEIIAANEDYIQVAISIGGEYTTQIYKWNENEITLVFEETKVKDPKKNILGEFKEDTDVRNSLLNSDGSADWKLISKNMKVNVPFGNFSNVYVIQKITNEVVGEKTIYTRYYAPGYGLIKEEFEVTGEQGYTGASSLSKVEKVGN
jgi:hypothetical protein